MFVSVRYDRATGWQVDENLCSLIPEFRSVLQDKELASKGMAYVALVHDPLSFLNSIPEAERSGEAIKTIWHDTTSPKNIHSHPKILAAIRKYEKLSNTAEVQMRKKYQDAAQNVVDHVFTVSQSINEKNIKDVISAVKDLPVLITAYTDMNKGTQESVEETKGVVRGGRSLSYRETKKRKK
jgi:hypothetical protein